MNDMLHRTRFVATLAATLLVFAASPSFAQQSASDSTRQQEVAEEEEEARRWGVGVQLSPVFGLSVRRALTERLAVQAAGIPFRIGEETVVGARLLFKLYTQPHYSFHVSGGGSAFIATNDRTAARDEEQETRVTPLYFGTLGGEYRFSRRLGLSGDVGLAYLQFEGRVITRSGVSPVLGLGLHYYF